MISLLKSIFDRNHTSSVRKHNNAVETAGSLAMLYQNGLLTMGQYDEFIASNPFAVDYSQYAEGFESQIAYDGFLSSFSNAVSTINGFSDGSVSVGCSSECSCGSSCGSFSSVC